MNEQALNTQINQYFNGNLSDAEFAHIVNQVADNKRLTQRASMCQLLEPYIDGSLSTKDRKNFERYLAKDAFLKEKVTDYNNVIGAVKSEGVEQLRKRFAAFDAELDKAYAANQAQLEKEYQEDLANEEDFLSQIELDEDGNFVAYNPNPSKKQHNNGTAIVRQLTQTRKRTAKQETVNHKKVSSVRTINRFLAKAAAVLLFLALPAYFFYASAEYSNDAIFANHYENYKPTTKKAMVQAVTNNTKHASGGTFDPTTKQSASTITATQTIQESTQTGSNTTLKMPTNLERIRLEAKVSYNNEDYSTATRLFQKLSDQLTTAHTYHAEAQFYLALSLLANNQAAQALPLLQQNTIAQHYQPHSQWYLGLAHLKTGNTQQATKLFKQLVKTNSPYAEKANNILQALNAKPWFSL